MGLGDWYQERKAKKTAKKEAARLAAGQARQAAEEEKKRQQEAQAQQSMGYTRNYIQMLERMQGAGDRKGYQNLAAMREQLVQGMGNSPHAQILTDALNASLKAADERISRAEKQEGHKETIRKERKTPLETLIRKEAEYDRRSEIQTGGRSGCRRDGSESGRKAEGVQGEDCEKQI